MLSRARLSIASEAIIVKQPPLPVRVFCNKPTSTLLFQTAPSNSIDQTNQIIHFTRASRRHFSFFYDNFFSHLRSPPTLFEARKLHALLIVGGYFHPTVTDRVLGSQLVNVYVKFGSLHEALLVFVKLPQKNNIAWNAILRGFIEVGQFAEAIEFYHLMLRQGFAPDNFTYPLVLKACSGLYALEEGRKVQELILFNENYLNLKCNIYVECAMIDMFAKCGSLEEARQLFEEMPRKDLASWSSMICGTLQNGEWFEALCLFRRMRLEGLQPDSVIVAAVLPACGRLETRRMGMALQGLIAGYSQNCRYRESIEMYLKMKSSGLVTNAVIAASVLPGFAKLKLLKQGKEMHNYILKQGFESDIVLGSALIDMYSNCGSKREAEYIFEIMSDRDITIWNSMIVGHSLYGDIGSAFGTFQRIWESKLIPNSITLVSILPMCTRMGTLRQGREIHCYAIRSSLETIVSVGNSLINMYCKCGYLEVGVKVFDRMMEKNIVTYNTIIYAHGIHGQSEKAFTFFNQMKEMRMRPNKVTFIALLSACSHAGLIDKGWFFYNSMICDYGILPDMQHYSCMVDLLGRAGHLVDAFNFIKRMPVEANINILGSLLGACRVHNKAELAELVGKQIFKHAKDPGYYVLLSNTYAFTERWEDVLRVRTIIKKKSLIKKSGNSWIQVGSCIHMFYARDGMHPEFNEIQETLERLLFEMKDEGYTPDSNFFFHDLVGDGDELINFDVG